MAGLNPKRIAQVAVPVRDLERAKAFYGEVLGLEWIADAPPGLSFYRCGEVRLMLSRPEGPESAASSILYYAVADVPAAAAALEAAGVTLEAPPHIVGKLDDREVWLAVFRDSEGNLCGLMN